MSAAPETLTDEAVFHAIREQIARCRRGWAEANPGMCGKAPRVLTVMSTPMWQRFIRAALWTGAYSPIMSMQTPLFTGEIEFDGARVVVEQTITCMDPKVPYAVTQVVGVIETPF